MPYGFIQETRIEMRNKIYNTIIDTSDWVEFSTCLIDPHIERFKMS